MTFDSSNAPRSSSVLMADLSSKKRSFMTVSGEGGLGGMAGMCVDRHLEWQAWNSLIYSQPLNGLDRPRSGH